MQIPMLRALPALFALMIMAVALRAQSGESVLHAHRSEARCGLELFGNADPAHKAAVAALISDPARRARAIEKLKSVTHGRALASVGDVSTFYMLNRTTQNFDEITAVLKYDGRLARIWIDVADTARIRSNVITPLARGLDSTTGSTSRDPSKSIIENDVDVFGNTPKTFEVDGKTDFLMTDIKDGLGGGAYIAGYFSPYDQSTDPGSNERNILYIDSKEGVADGVTSLLNTMAHEFQHLIHYGINPNSEVFYNEGCSEVASIICGYKNRGNSGFMSNTNVRFLGWNDNDAQLVLNDYERAMTFVYYLYDHFGESFLHEFVKTNTNGVTRVDRTLSALSISSTYQDVLKGFAVANAVLTGLTDDRYRYETRLTNTMPKVTSTYSGSLPDSGGVTLQSYGSAYFLVNSPSKIRVRFDGSRVFSVMAIVYRANVADEVIDLTPGTTYVLNEAGTASKILFSVVSVSGPTSTVTWTNPTEPAGVNDQNGMVAMAAAIVPQPVRAGVASLDVTSSSAGLVNAVLYDVTGRTIETMVDGAWIPAGQHRFDLDLSWLRSGTYLVRVALPDGLITRRLVVLN